jgi:hypothetical protein
MNDDLLFLLFQILRANIAAFANTAPPSKTQEGKCSS